MNLLTSYFGVPNISVVGELKKLKGGGSLEVDGSIWLASLITTE